MLRIGYFFGKNWLNFVDNICNCWQKLVTSGLHFSIYWHGLGFLRKELGIFLTRIGYSLPRIGYILERIKHFVQELVMFGKN